MSYKQTSPVTLAMTAMTAITAAVGTKKPHGVLIDDNGFPIIPELPAQLKGMLERGITAAVGTKRPHGVLIGDNGFPIIPELPAQLKGMLVRGRVGGPRFVFPWEIRSPSVDAIVEPSMNRSYIVVDESEKKSHKATEAPSTSYTAETVETVKPQKEVIQPVKNVQPSKKCLKIMFKCVPPDSVKPIIENAFKMFKSKSLFERLRIGAIHYMHTRYHHRWRASYKEENTTKSQRKKYNQGRLEKVWQSWGGIKLSNQKLDWSRMKDYFPDMDEEDFDVENDGDDEDVADEEQGM
ncbi:hypothetical protein RUND412_007518 [Rhizina undulata]